MSISCLYTVSTTSEPSLMAESLRRYSLSPVYTSIFLIFFLLSSHDIEKNKDICG